VFANLATLVGRYPKVIRVDNGSEFISRNMDLWAYQRVVILDFSRPGKPTDDAFIEAFNCELRGECLNLEWFLSLQDACEKLEEYRGSDHLPYKCTLNHKLARIIARTLAQT